MDYRVVAFMVAFAPLACTQRAPPEDTDATSAGIGTMSPETGSMSSETGGMSAGTVTTSAGMVTTSTGTSGTSADTFTTEADPQDEGCSGAGVTGGVFEYSEAWIVDPSAPETPLWTAPRQACELSTIVDFDVADDGAVYALGTAFLHRERCEGTCPWRFWLSRIGASGEEEWTSTFDFPALDLRAVRALADGGVVIGGAARVGDERSPWLARLDAAGATLWEDIFPEQGQINAIARGPDDVVVAVGNVVAGDATNLWVVQMSSGGTLGWTSTLDDGLEESGLAVVVDVTGRSWIAGGRAAFSSSGSVNYYSDASGDWWYVFPESFRYDVNFEQPFVALLDEQGALLWLDEPASQALWGTGLGIDLLPGGDAVVGVSWFDEGEKWIARYAADGSRVWETFVTPTGEDPSDRRLDEVVCDALGRTHVLVSGGTIVQLDDAGNVIDSLVPETSGDQLALTPAGSLRAAHWRHMGVFMDTWDGTSGG